MSDPSDAAAAADPIELACQAIYAECEGARRIAATLAARVTELEEALRDLAFLATGYEGCEAQVAVHCGTCHMTLDYIYETARAALAPTDEGPTPCPDCFGKGLAGRFLPAVECRFCRGSGVVPTDEGPTP